MVDFLLLLFFLFIMFFMGFMVEINSVFFDLVEVEFEFVSGFMIEYLVSVFVFFFLVEYVSIMLICVLNSILFFGGYLCIMFVELLMDILYILFGINSFML